MANPIESTPRKISRRDLLRMGGATALFASTYTFGAATLESIEKSGEFRRKAEEKANNIYGKKTLKILPKLKKQYLLQKKNRLH